MVRGKRTYSALELSVHSKEDIQDFCRSGKSANKRYKLEIRDTKGIGEMPYMDMSGCIDYTTFDTLAEFQEIMRWLGGLFTARIFVPTCELAYDSGVTVNSALDGIFGKNGYEAKHLEKYGYLPCGNYT